MTAYAADLYDNMNNLEVRVATDRDPDRLRIRTKTRLEP